tara:strand:- start:124 stop:342 length:219 start_codon:yes stop_codon:yes gene_type:complete
MAISKIVTAAIATDTVGAEDIGADAITASELGNLSVDTAAIQNLAVTKAKVDLTVANTGRNVAMSMIFGSYQ